MALYVPGMNCRLCSYKIEEHDPIIMFPSFIENKADPIYLVNDAVFHLNCFNKQNYAERALMLLNEYTAKLSPKRCELCNSIITDPDNYIAIGCLTSNSNNKLFEYNFKKYHKSCFYDNEVDMQIKNLCKELLKSDQWGGPLNF